MEPTDKSYMGVSQFRGPKNKDYSILGSILGSPYFGKLPYTPLQLPLDSFSHSPVAPARKGPLARNHTDKTGDGAWVDIALTITTSLALLCRLP